MPFRVEVSPGSWLGVIRKSLLCIIKVRGRPEQRLSLLRGRDGSDLDGTEVEEEILRREDISNGFISSKTSLLYYMTLPENLIHLQENVKEIKNAGCGKTSCGSS